MLEKLKKVGGFAASGLTWVADHVTFILALLVGVLFFMFRSKEIDLDRKGVEDQLEEHEEHLAALDHAKGIIDAAHEKKTEEYETLLKKYNDKYGSGGSGSNTTH